MGPRLLRERDKETKQHRDILRDISLGHLTIDKPQDSIATTKYSLVKIWSQIKVLQTLLANERQREEKKFITQ